MMDLRLPRVGATAVVAGAMPTNDPGGRVRHLRVERGALGQALVEFGLVFPLFLIVMLGIIEFAFVFNAVLATDFASRTAALAGAEAGSAIGADCVILRSVERELGAPTDRTRIVTVAIYRSDTNGKQLGNAVMSYTRTGTTTCDLSDGDRISVPYSLAGPPGYPASDRCSVLLGCPAGPSGTHTGLDTIGVRIEYSHLWRTPLNNFLPGSGAGYVFFRSNAMRMEPIL